MRTTAGHNYDNHFLTEVSKNSSITEFTSGEKQELSMFSEEITSSSKMLDN